MHAVRKWNSAGMVCVFGHDLLNEYELNVHNTHINEMDCYMMIERKNILYLSYYPFSNNVHSILLLYVIMI